MTEVIRHVHTGFNDGSAAPARHEAPEREDARNVVLDLVEQAIRSALDMDLEAPLRVRLDRLMPRPVPPPAPAAAPKLVSPPAEEQLHVVHGEDAIQRAQHKLTWDSTGRIWLETPLRILRAYRAGHLVWADQAVGYASDTRVRGGAGAASEARGRADAEWASEARGSKA